MIFQPKPFVAHGNEFDPFQHRSTPVDLPVGTYGLQYHELRGYYLVAQENLAVPQRIYGPHHETRIMAAYQHRAAQGLSTGVWLNGEKGAGKTLLAAQLSQEMRTLGFSTILIQSAFNGPAFNDLIAHLGSALVLFDEFEKVYDLKPKQDALLTLFAGAGQASHLYVLTSNTHWGVQDAFVNRPGRLRYFIEFRGISEQVATEYCEDRLQDKSRIQEVVQTLQSVPECNFDILQAVVEEHNLFGGPVADVLAFMNVSRKALNLYTLTWVGTDDDHEAKEGEEDKPKPILRGTGKFKGALERSLQGGHHFELVIQRPEGPRVQHVSVAEDAQQAWGPDGSCALATSDGYTGTLTFTPQARYSTHHQAF